MRGVDGSAVLQPGEAGRRDAAGDALQADGLVEDNRALSRSGGANGRRDWERRIEKMRRSTPHNGFWKKSQSQGATFTPQVSLPAACVKNHKNALKTEGNKIPTLQF